MAGKHGKISAFVIAYNRAHILGTCLRALRFADEVIVVDKSSTDDTRTVAERHASRVVTVPWTPTVEETRDQALSLCAHDWILFLDDDECLSPATPRFLREQVLRPRADIYALPLRHYILGEHDEAAYYWPEHHVRFFRRGTVAFSATVHAGIQSLSPRIMRVPADIDVCIHHLSHPTVSGWIERANRYTDRADRARVEDDGHDLAGFAHARLHHWMARSGPTAPDGYPAAAAVLRAVYDIVDRLKTWEEARGRDGDALLRDACAWLDACHARPPRPVLDGLMARWISRRACRRLPE